MKCEEAPGGFFSGLAALAGGFAITLRHLFRRPITEQYPEEKRILPVRSRGRIILTRDPDGGERCVACYLCSAVCPVSCISMQSAERPGSPDGPPGGRRFASWFRINFARCIYCGFCEEACPTLAIQLTPDYETCQRDPLTLVAEKSDLLVDHGGRHPDYNFYRHAGVAVIGSKGSNPDEDSPVNLRSNLP